MTDRPSAQSRRSGPVGGTLSAPGKTLTFMRGPEGRLRFREDVGPDAPPVPMHRHMRQTERFTVIEGRLILTLEGVLYRLEEGQSLEVPPGKAHTYAPYGEDGMVGPVLIEVEIWPDFESRRFFEAIYGLTREARLPPRGLRDVIALMSLSHAHGFVIAGPPVRLALALSGLAAAIAAVLRIEAWSPRFAAKPEAASLDGVVYLPGPGVDMP